MRLCIYCDGPSEGRYSIPLDESMDGPEVWLCDAHGEHRRPTCPEIWEHIAARPDRLTLDPAYINNEGEAA